MALLNSSSCIAITWDDDGRFYGVRMERDGDAGQVTEWWRATKLTSQSAAQIIEEGLPQLKADEDTPVLIGGNHQKSCFFDVRLPKMAPADMRSALAFQVGKYSPLPVDDLQWGFRVVGKAGGDQQMVRVSFFSQSEWNSWVAAASAVGTGVDLIMPASSAMDPVLGEQDVCFPLSNGGPLTIFRQQESGSREVVAAPKILDEVFGAGEEPLQSKSIHAGELAELADSEQRQFVPALTLGLYGLSDGILQDRKTWLPVPLEMRPRRNRGAKFYTLALLTYIFFVAAFYICSLVYRNHQELNAYAQLKQQLEQEVERLTPPAEDEEQVAAMEEQISQSQESLASFSEGLVTITNLTGVDLWCTNLSWDTGRVRFDVQTLAGNTKGIDVIRETELLTDMDISKRSNRENDVYTVNCRPLKWVGPAPRKPAPPPEEPTSDLEEGADDDDGEEAEAPEVDEAPKAKPKAPARVIDAAGAPPPPPPPPVRVFNRGTNADE